jgi:hypothetical protein
VPEVTLVFWIIKIAATTLGETGGDSVTMTLNWGYLAGTALFLGFLAVLVIAQILAKRFHPFLYWATIIASTTFGTTMADFADRSLGIGYTGGSALLFVCLFTVLGGHHFREHRDHAESGSVLLGRDHVLADTRYPARRLGSRYRRTRLPWRRARVRCRTRRDRRTLLMDESLVSGSSGVLSSFRGRLVLQSATFWISP